MEHYTVRDLPDSERPYEKCMAHGTEALSDAELLAIILRSGTRNTDCLELARLLLRGREGNLLNLFSYSYEELKKIPGIGNVKAMQLKCVAELAVRIAKTERLDRILMTDAASVASYFMEELRHETKENLVAAMFDTKNHFLGEAVISVGTVKSAVVSPREIFLKALEMKAVYLILIHNHPSGDSEPSREDIYVTRRITECGKLLEIELLDHIIIGDNSYTSLKEKGYM